MNYGHILKQLVVSSGLNQKQFAEKYKLQECQVSNCINNKKQIVFSRLEHIAFNEGYEIKASFELIKIE